ncbi:MAG: GntR family transcriptional regulator [Vagococcus sp.]
MEFSPLVTDFLPANSLMINPNTISRAYKLLEEENIIITIHGKGTFIKDVSVNQQDSETTARIKKDLEILLVDAYYANIDKKDILDWVTNFSISMEGL